MVRGIFLNLRENHLKNNYSYLLLIFFNLRLNEKIEIFATFYLTFAQTCCNITDVVNQHVCSWIEHLATDQGVGGSNPLAHVTEAV